MPGRIFLRWTMVLMLSMSGAAGFGAQETAEKIAFFEKRVRPILAQRCYACHSEAAGKKKGGLTLDRRDRLLQGGASGPAVVPGRTDSSLLVQAVRYASEELKMPPSGPLAAREVADLAEWVRQGAVMPNAPTGNANGASLTEGRRHWAFQPLRTHTPPAVKDPSWARRPLDLWVLAVLDQQGLKPSVPASRRQLIRRVTFDLVGLPPTPEEIDAFETDSRPDAYERLVDRLLMSPHHGERWGRFWLDLARYCDITEPWAEVKGQPFLYRDWVVRALNEDMPFDRFVRLQIAADHCADRRPEDLAALGFFGLSPSYWKELNLDKDVIRAVVAEEWEERIATVSGTFLGLSVACARCHDHKHDPITMRDYYALAGVFASTRLVDRELLEASQETRVRKLRLEAARLEAKVKELQKPKKDKSADSQQLKALRGALDALRKAHPELGQPAAAGVEDSFLQVLADGPHRTKLVYKPGDAHDVPMHKRGNPAQEGDVTPRRFLEVLSPPTPRLLHTGSGRADLADALLDEAGPLTSRVIVNRVWRHHFGRGLVFTPSDFGLQGERPSHPELLDDLAKRFIASGWSLRWLHRELLLSATYQQSSAPGETHQRIDPENRLLGRMNRRRLEAEAWRDALLTVAGTLDLTVGGPPRDLGDASNRRRTLYGVIKRRELNDYLRLYDFPDPVAHSPARLPTITPLQQLFTLNSPLMLQQSAAFAKRLEREIPRQDAAARIQRSFLLAYGRPASEVQVQQCLEFLSRGTESATPITDAAWRQFAQVILGSNEFQFVD